MDKNAVIKTCYYNAIEENVIYSKYILCQILDISLAASAKENPLPKKKNM